MAIETRTIIFSAEELAVAAFAFCVGEGLVPPGAEADQIFVDDDAYGAVTLLYSDGAEVVRLADEEMLRAVIAHCASVAIPLPRHARKALRPTGDGLALVMRLPEFVGEAAAVEAAFAQSTPALGA